MEGDPNGVGVSDYTGTGENLFPGTQDEVRFSVTPQVTGYGWWWCTAVKKLLKEGATKGTGVKP